MSNRPPPLSLDSDGAPATKAAMSPGTPGDDMAVPALDYGVQQHARPSAPADTGADHVQFATYRQEKPNWPPSRAGEAPPVVLPDKWLPLPLRPRFWIPYLIILVGIAVGLEIALNVNHADQGWSTSSGSDTGAMHYAFTLPAVVASMFVASVWAWTDIEIKKMQPYVDLAYGNAPPHKTLLLDYTRTNNFFVWEKAFRNKHYTVTLASIIVLVTLTLSPLSAAIFSVAQVNLQQDPQNITSLATLGVNTGPTIVDVSAFVTAAGYASSTVLYNLGPSPWTSAGYSIPQIQLSPNATNGTMVVQTVAVQSIPHCTQPDAMNLMLVGDTWHNSAVYKNCNYTWLVNHEATDLFGLDVLGNGTSQTSTSSSTAQGDGCAVFGAQHAEQRPVVLWFFTYRTKPATGALAFCTPEIQLWNVDATVDLNTGNVTNITPTSKLDPAAANNVTALNGLAYNGVAWSSDNSSLALNTSVDQFVTARQNATRLQLPAAVFQATAALPGGFAASVSSFNASSFNNTMVVYSNNIYQMYLQTLAQTLYFVDGEVSNTAQSKVWQPRIWMSDLAVHLVVAALGTIVFVGFIVHLLHRGDRVGLILGHAPGTIASAVAIGGQTDVGAALSGRQRAEDIRDALKDHRFRIDPRTLKIMMEGEDGYAEAVVPDPRRQTVFGRLQLGLQPPSPLRRGFTRRGRGADSAPGTPSHSSAPASAEP